MRIITLTLNPAFDVHCDIPGFQPYHENLARITAKDAGGKGINISRALSANGVDNLAFVLLGEENASDFQQALVRDGLTYHQMTVPGRIRENLTCHTEGVPETRISFSGFSVDADRFAAVGRWLDEVVDEDTVVTFTGRAPDGVDMEAVLDLLRGVQRKGGRLVIDSRSLQLDHLRAVKPWLIKPNQEEISYYLGRDVTDFDSIAGAAEQLHRDGIANVLVSLGGAGALLACEQGVFTAGAAPVEVCSTVGAGDSMIAGFLTGEHGGKQPAECLALAVAYGSAACTTMGTRPPDGETIVRLLNMVRVEKRA